MRLMNPKLSKWLRVNFFRICRRPNSGRFTETRKLNVNDIDTTNRIKVLISSPLDLELHKFIEKFFLIDSQNFPLGYDFGVL